MTKHDDSGTPAIFSASDDPVVRLAIGLSLAAVVAALLQTGWVFGSVLGGGLLIAWALHPAGWRRGEEEAAGRTTGGARCR